MRRFASGVTGSGGRVEGGEKLVVGVGEEGSSRGEEVVGGTAAGHGGTSAVVDVGGGGSGGGVRLVTGRRGCAVICASVVLLSVVYLVDEISFNRETNRIQRRIDLVVLQAERPVRGG